MPSRAELRADGIGVVVFDAGEATRAPGRLPRADRALRGESLASVVLGTPAPKRGLGLGLCVAVIVHGALVVATTRWPAARPLAPPQRAAAALRLDAVVELDPPAAPPPAAAPPAAPPPRPAGGHRAAARAAPARPVPPAAAGKVVAAEPRADEPLDFTGFDIATGKGQEYAGGITASSGTNTQAVHGEKIDRDAPPGSSAGSRARPVGLPATEWSCPWPREAEALSLDEESVLLRVVVRPDGGVASAALVSDPGHGFGAVALACARAQRFPPARDEAGQAITATSPPIRVKFTRP